MRIEEKLIQQEERQFFVFEKEENKSEKKLKQIASTNFHFSSPFLIFHSLFFCSVHFLSISLKPNQSSSSPEKKEKVLPMNIKLLATMNHVKSSIKPMQLTTETKVPQTSTKNFQPENQANNSLTNTILS